MLPVRRGAYSGTLTNGKTRISGNTLTDFPLKYIADPNVINMFERETYQSYITNFYTKELPDNYRRVTCVLSKLQAAYGSLYLSRRTYFRSKEKSDA